MGKRTCGGMGIGDVDWFGEFAPRRPDELSGWCADEEVDDAEASGEPPFDGAERGGVDAAMMTPPRPSVATERGAYKTTGGHSLRRTMAARSRSSPSRASGPSGGARSVFG